MKLYFVRHGKAQTGDGRMQDHDRPLTPTGVARLETEAAVLARLGLKLDTLYSSPRVRARQTAEIIGKALDQAVEIREEVNFDFDMTVLAALTEPLADNAGVMFVGHNPSMEDVVRRLTSADVMMKVGSLARVDVDAPKKDLHGVLVWLLAPRVFDGLAD